jgi:RNA recognition motif-containing protein
LKNLHFKAEQKDIEDFFLNMKITNIMIPKYEGKSKGFGYVEFEKFKDYQTALDMHKGTLFGR